MKHKKNRSALEPARVDPGPRTGARNQRHFHATRYFSILFPLLVGIGQQSPAEAAELHPVEPLQEYIDQVRAVSGSRNVIGITLSSRTYAKGVTALAAALEQPTQAVRVFVPDELSAADLLEIEIQSADSRYRAIGAFQGQSTHGGWFRMPLRSATGDPLKLDGRAASFAVGVKRRTDTPSRRSELLMTTWQNTEEFDTMLLMLRSQNSRRVEISSRNGHIIVYDCEPAPSDSHVIFDRVCQIPLRPNIHASETRLEARIWRITGSRRTSEDILIPLPHGHSIDPNRSRIGD